MVQNKKSQNREKDIEESYATQSKTTQNALIQSKVFKQAKKLMGDTIEANDIETKQKHNKTEFL